MTNTTSTVKTLRDAVGALIKARGRFHTEQNYAALVAAYDAALAAPILPVAGEGELPEGFQPLETVRYWAEAYAKEPQKLAGGMIVKLLQEYATLRAAIAQRAPIEAKSVHQVRDYKSDVWRDCKKDEADLLAGNPVFQCRTLYTAPVAPVEAPGGAVKDHVIREVVNKLRDTAIEFHGTQQLRNRIAYAIGPLLQPAPAPVADASEACQRNCPIETPYGLASCGKCLGVDEPAPAPVASEPAPNPHHEACDRKRPTLCNGCIAEDAADVPAQPGTAAGDAKRAEGDELAKLREALQTGLEAAQQVASGFHEAYSGFYPDDHARVDVDVKCIEDAIAALATPAAQESLSAKGGGDALDGARLEFVMEREAWIAWSKDGESCRLFHRNKDDGEPMPMLGWGARHWSHDPREAIDAARAASDTQGGA